MRNFTIAGVVLLLCFAVAPAHAQSGRSRQQQAHDARRAEIRRHNDAQQEAIRLLFGPQGLPALTRPSDPWNYQRPRFSYVRPNGYRYPAPLYNY
jgi:hypothetical protein